MKRVLFLSCCLVLASTLHLLPGEQPEFLKIGSRLELFVDDYLIESMEGASRKLHHPEATGDRFLFDRPWEGNTSAYVTILEADGLYRMYYRGSSSPDYVVRSVVSPHEQVPDEHPQFTCYAESRDGIRWTKPSLGLHEFEGSKDNNIIWVGEGAHNFAPFIDANPSVPDSKRYKAVAGAPLIGLTSADGIHWRKVREEPIITDGAFDSQNVVFWDSQRVRYVAIYRDFRHGIRTIKYATSKDFLKWTPGQWAEFGDGTPSTQLYTNATVPYPRAPHIYLAFPKRFIPWRTPAHLEVDRPGLSDAVFMSSRDGVHWNLFPEAFIWPGSDARNWIHRCNMVARGLLFSSDNEISFYVSRHYTYPSAHLERMVIRIDGFVSIHGDERGGELVTKPLLFLGDNLYLNYATSAAGSLRVQIEDLNGNAIPGYSFEESPVMYGDFVEKRVVWKRPGNDPDKPLARLQDLPLRFHFLLREADLYSMQFK